MAKHCMLAASLCELDILRIDLLLLLLPFGGSFGGLIDWEYMIDFFIIFYFLLNKS